MLTLIVFLVLGYLFGSLSSAVIVCKLMKLPDPRVEGSKNPGATNVLRIGGKIPALFTLLADVLKGFIPVILARMFCIDGFLLGLVGVFAVFGHMHPIFFKFKGGKGVATFFILALSFFDYIIIAFNSYFSSFSLPYSFSLTIFFTAFLSFPLSIPSFPCRRESSNKKN